MSRKRSPAEAERVEQMTEGCGVLLPRENHSKTSFDGGERKLGRVLSTTTGG